MKSKDIIMYFSDKGYLIRDEVISVEPFVTYNYPTEYMGDTSHLRVCTMSEGEFQTMHRVFSNNNMRDMNTAIELYPEYFV